MKSLLFVQFANSMFPQYGNAASRYYDAFYDKYCEIGYWKGEDFFEPPKWIAEICYLVPTWNKELHVARDVESTISFIKESAADYVLMSLMDCNRHFIEEIVKRCPEKEFILGGYNNEVLRRLHFENKNVTWAQAVKEEAVLFGVPYKYGTDYSLFEGFECIPRLTLSDGCLNRCKFCTVPHNKVTPRSNEEIYEQVESFKVLQFKLIYLDDKTFGQCSNWIILPELKEKILKYNPDFEGFIVQTTAPLLSKKFADFERAGVKFAEVGMETYNDEILREYSKPSTCAAVRRCVNLSSRNLRLICNVVVGFPEETEKTYRRTERFISRNMDGWFFCGINPAIYTDYSLENSGGEVEFVNDPDGFHEAAFTRICDAATKNVQDFHYF